MAEEARDGSGERRRDAEIASDSLVIEQVAQRTLRGRAGDQQGTTEGGLASIAAARLAGVRGP